MAIAVSLPAVPARAAKPDSAARAYEVARRAFYLLKANAGTGAGRAVGRAPWLRAAEGFEQVAEEFPASPQAPEALYTAAELRRQLARISLSAGDRQAAVADYAKVAKTYPQSPLADDALFQMASCALEADGGRQAVRALLDELLHRYPHADMAKRARAMRANVPDDGLAAAEPPAARPAAAAKNPIPAAAPAAAKLRRLLPVAARAHPEFPAAPDGGAAAGGAAGAETPPDVEAPDEADPEPPTPEPSPAAEAQAAPEAAPAAASGAASTHPLLDALRRAGRSRGAIPLAVQMGLKVRRVVVDAGHGGNDSGAQGPAGTKEKEVTLAIARKLARDLRALGLEVLLSRDADRYVALEERARLANDAKADLFISIHCNAARDRQLRGTETYFLNVTDDRYAMKLAARENQASEKSLSDLQLILADMATKADVEESERLAREVQQALTDRSSDRAPEPGRRDLGVKHALFYVLLGTRMPAVLVETAFLSNPDDERRLASAKVQGELAEDIARGVQSFLSQRQGLAELVR